MKRLLWVSSVVCMTALIVGYGAGSRRVSTLETFLDRAALEQDALRGLAAEQSYQLDRITDLRLTGVDTGESARLRDELDRTLAFLTAARASADEKARIADEQRAARTAKEIALGECTDVQGRLEQQLETCVFEKASLERRASAGGPAGRPVTGTSRFSQTIEYPAAEAGE